MSNMKIIYIYLRCTGFFKLPRDWILLTVTLELEYHQDSETRYAYIRQVYLGVIVYQRNNFVIFLSVSNWHNFFKIKQFREATGTENMGAGYSYQMFAAIVSANQLNAEFSGFGFLIGSRQRLLQTVAPKSCVVYPINAGWQL